MVYNEHHNAEVSSARQIADEEVANSSADILANIQSEFTYFMNWGPSTPTVCSRIF